MNMDDCSVRAPDFAGNGNEKTGERDNNYIIYLLRLLQLKYLFERSPHNLF